MVCDAEGGCGCCARLSKKPAPAPRRKDNDYNVEEKYKVAFFKRNMVANQMNYSFLSTRAVRSMIDPRYISRSILGKTWKILSVFLIAWITVQVLMQSDMLCPLFYSPEMQTNPAVNSKAPTSHPGRKLLAVNKAPAGTKKNLTSSVNQQQGVSDQQKGATNQQQGVSDQQKGATNQQIASCTPLQKKQQDIWFKSSHEYDKLSATYLVFILGFYVKQLVARWWDQVKNLPEIDNILNQLSGLVFDASAGKEGVSPASLSLSKTVSRYALLSWTMCMSSISKPLHLKYVTGEDFINKGLLTKEEFDQLKVGTSKDGWRDQWMIPLSWAICDANTATNKSKLIPKDHKNLVGALNYYHKQLSHLKRVSKNPLPVIYKQAVTTCLWVWLIMGVVASQGSHTTTVLNGIFFQNFPFYQAIKILLLFGWLKVSEMIHNPFGNDTHFDINVVEKLDVEIWKASVAMKNIDQAV